MSTKLGAVPIWQAGEDSAGRYIHPDFDRLPEHDDANETSPKLSNFLSEAVRVGGRVVRGR